MARPFLIVGALALIASFMSINAGAFEIGLFLSVSAFIIIIFTVRNREKIYKGVLVALIFIMLIVRFATLMTYIEKTNAKLIGRTAEIEGTLTEILVKDDNFSRYTVKIDSSTNEAAEGITVDATMFGYLSATAGDRVTATAVFNKLTDRYKAYNFGEGRYFSCEIQKIEVYDNERLNVWRIAHNIRQSIREAINMGGSGEEGAVLNALIIGDISGISDSLNNNVKAAGVSHMLVVSGMHLGIICGVLIRLLRKRTKRWVTAAVGMLTAVFITVVCLFHMSIFRASIAYFAMLFGTAARKNSDGLSSLGFGAAVAVFIYPYIFHNAAFLLSFTATFAVLYPAHMLIKAVPFEKLGKLQKPIKYAYEILAISICAMFCTLPVVAYYFGYVALIAPVTNLAVTFAVSAALVFGVLATLLYFVPFVGRLICLPFYFVARIFISYFIEVVNFIGNRGYGVINIPYDKNIYCFFIAVAFILLIRAFYSFRLRRGERVCLAERQNT